MSLPSDKYKQTLLSTKKMLMLEISSYLNEFKKFEMSKETIIDYLTDLGTFQASFDVVRGDSTNIKIYNKKCDFITVLGFDADNYINVEKDIPFLMRLLDYIDLDYRDQHNGKRPGEK